MSAFFISFTARGSLVSILMASTTVPKASNFSPYILYVLTLCIEISPKQTHLWKSKTKPYQA